MFSSHLFPLEQDHHINGNREEIPIVTHSYIVKKEYAHNILNLFNHLILASEVFIGEQVSVNLGYNFMRRFDLNIQGQQNALNGFSSGLALQLQRLELQYGNAFFQKNMYHHFSLMYNLKNR